MSRSLPRALVPAALSRFPHKPRALLGLYGAAGITHEELTHGLTEWQHARVLGRLRVGITIPGTEELLQDTIGAYFGEPIAPLDAFATIDVEHYQPTGAELDALIELLPGIADELSGVVDPSRSFAMAGLVNLVFADEGPYAMMLMCTHHPGVDLEATHAWWCSFGEAMHQAGAGHTLGYHQLQCEPELSRRAVSVSGLSSTSFDLGDLVFITSVEEFVARARPQPGPAIDPGPPINQRDSFITFRGSVGAFCSMLTP